MKGIKVGGLTIVGYLIGMQQAFAGTLPPNGGIVPEIDGAGAIIAIGLVAGLVALVRERYFRK